MLQRERSVERGVDEEEKKISLPDHRQGRQVFIKEHVLFLLVPSKLFASVYPQDKDTVPFLARAREPGLSYSNPS